MTVKELRQRLRAFPGHFAVTTRVTCLEHDEPVHIEGIITGIGGAPDDDQTVLVSWH